MSYQNLILTGDKPNQNLVVNSINTNNLVIENYLEVQNVNAIDYVSEYLVPNINLTAATEFKLVNGTTPTGNLSGLDLVTMTYTVPSTGVYSANMQVFYVSGTSFTNIQYRFLRAAATVQFGAVDTTDILGPVGSFVELSPIMLDEGDELTFYIESDTTCVVNVFGKIQRLY